MAHSSFFRPIPTNTVIGLSRPVAQDTQRFLYAGGYIPLALNQPIVIGTHAGEPTTNDGDFFVGYGFLDTNNVLWVCTATGSPGTFVAINDQVNPNLLFNGTGVKGRGASIDGWTSSDGNWNVYSLIEGDETIEWGGAPALITDNGVGGGTSGLVSLAPIHATSGDEFTFSAYLSASTGSKAELQLQAYDGSAWSTFASVSTTSTTPVFSQCNGKAPANTTQVRGVFASIEAASKSNNSFALGKIEKGSVATPYVESEVTAPWTSYTPVLSGTGWALGNGYIFGKYRFLDATTAVLFIFITIGSTTTIGSGQLALSLPAGMSFDMTAAEDSATVLYNDSSGDTYTGLANVISSDTLQPLASNPSAYTLQPFDSSYISPANGATITIKGIFQIA